MHEIEAMRTRLNAAEGLADTLAAGWDAFALVQAVTDDCADRMPAAFAAFMLAAAAAASGRDVLGFAPSMPSGPGAPVVTVGSDGTGVHEVVSLASALADRLQAAARHAQDQEDRHACEQAVVQASRIEDLLGPGR